MQRSKIRENIAFIARKDIAESRLTAGKNTDVLYRRGFYKFLSFIRIVSFAVAMFFFLIVLLKYLFPLLSSSLSDSLKNENRLMLNNILFPLLLFVSGFILSCPKSDSTLKTVINTVGVCLLVLSGVWLCFYVLSLMQRSINYLDGGFVKYLLRHFAPVAVLEIITVVLCILKIAEHHTFVNHYNEVCREAYNRFLESHADGDYSDSQWQEYFNNYSREARAFPLKRSLKDKRRKQKESKTGEE